MPGAQRPLLTPALMVTTGAQDDPRRGMANVSTRARRSSAKCIAPSRSVRGKTQANSSPPVAHTKVTAPAHRPAQCASRRAQASIALKMSVNIVELLEMVDIHQDDRQVFLRPCETRHFLDQKGLKHTSIAQPGQRINQREVGQLVAHLLHVNVIADPTTQAGRLDRLGHIVDRTGRKALDFGFCRIEPGGENDR